jgi:threonine synthase
VVAEAARLKSPSIVTASTGNAASALAAVCASSGSKAIIFVPEKAPKAKLVQMILYGATVVPVRGTYDDAFALSIRYTDTKGGLNRNTAYHPLTIEGKKSAGLEIWAQNQFVVPDAIIIPVGDGVILAGIFKAFYDLRQAGLIEKLPRLISVQAEGSAAIHRYVTSGAYTAEQSPSTLADSISVSVPSNAHYARHAITESDGCSVVVSDQEIVAAQRLLAESTGIFAEPAAAAAAAGAQKLALSHDPHLAGRVVLLITGHGLKDIDVPLRNLRIPPSVDPSESSFHGI